MMTLGKEVSIGAISKELKALLADDTSRTNACMMNLAVFTEDSNQLEENYARISTLTENHSCRALSIALDREAETRTTCWVSAHCNMSNGKKTVCCEHLSFLLEGVVGGRLRNTVFANLNSDLPLVFWWQGELTNAFEPSLYAVIDRFIFNSNEWSDHRAGYEILGNVLEEKPRFIIQDLAWTQSHAFRLAFAGVFDEELARKEFSNLKEVRIRVGAGYEATGLLMLAWLATQSGWQYKGSDESTYAFLDTKGQEVIASLTVEGTLPVSELAVSTGSANFAIKQNEGEDYLHQVCNCESGIHEMTTTSGAMDEISLVADQLARGGKNSLLRKTLPMFLQLSA